METSPIAPLAGLRVIEVAGLGPAPFCAMMLADLGAEVLRVERPPVARSSPTDPPPADIVERGRAGVWHLDLRHPAEAGRLRNAVRKADILLEGFRPGAMERMGLGPEVLMVDRPQLVYGRMTGWGQEGPLAKTAGHDINYIGLAGVLDMIGEAEGRPIPPLNLVGDYGGGGMLLAVGVLAAVLHAQRTGQGQIVDAAMVDGASLLSTLFYSLHNANRLSSNRGSNLLDGGAPFYRTYETADGKYMALGALEQRFFDIFAQLSGLGAVPEAERLDPRNWPELAERLSDLFRSRTRTEWTTLFESTDACCTPVLTLEEASRHPQMRARGTILDVAGVLQPAPAPRFGSTTAIPASVRTELRQWESVLSGWGVELDPIGVGASE